MVIESCMVIVWFCIIFTSETNMQYLAFPKALLAYRIEH